MQYPNKYYCQPIKEAKQQISNEKRISAIVLAILPVFSPYAISGSLSVNMAVLGMAVVILILINRKINFKMIIPVLLLWLSHLLLSMQAVYSTSSSSSLINSMIIISYNVLCIGILWSHCDFDSFVKYANYIGILCCLFLFAQAIYLAIGLVPPSGRLFNLKLLDYSSFVSTTWGYRLNSVFQEPSYFAIYLLPLLTINLQKKHNKLALLIILALVLSSSSLGVAGGIVVILYYLLSERRNASQLIFIVIVALSIHLLLYNFSDYYVSSITRTINKALSITGAGNDIRFTGQIELFQHMPLINQFFGVGISQMQNYFASIGLDVYNYSNSFVATLINCGLIGLASYVIFIFYTLYKSIKDKSLIFMVIFIMVAATDYLIYNSFFFYLLTYIFLIKDRRISDESLACDTKSV